MLLTGCGEESGFSLAHTDYNGPEEQEQDPNSVTENVGDSVYGGGGGSNSEEHPEDAQTPIEDIQPGTPEEPVTQVDLGTQVVTFNLSFVSIDDENYVFVSFTDDPFAEKYNFAYYTIDEKQLDNSNTVSKEMVEEKETYKIFLGSNESKIYTIQFYNKDGKQYGKANITVDVPTVQYSFFNNIINIVQIKIVSIGLNFIQQINKIGEFFKKIFGGRGLAY